MLAGCALLAGCGSVGEAPGPRDNGDIITGAGGAGPLVPAAGDGGSGGRQAAPSRRGPPYPIVLAHGFFGFDDFAGAGFVTYFYKVKDALNEKGEMAYTPTVDPFNSSTYRGAQLLAAIETILATTGYEKVNIIAHSQGGLDARFVAHERPDLVASVVTIATPHKGSRVADVALQLVGDSRLSALLDEFVQLVGTPLYDDVGEETSLAASLKQFSAPGIEEFNAIYTDAPSVFYASIGGRTDRSDGGGDCLSLERPPFVVQFERDLDPVNALLTLTEEILDGGFGESVPNDGMVRARDSRWGHFWGCVPADHFDEIGQILGQSPGDGNSWRYVEFYEDLVAYLRQEGF